MKALFIGLIVLGIGAAFFVLGPTLYQKGRVLARDGHGDFGGLRIEFRRGCDPGPETTLGDPNMGRKLGAVRESLAEVDGDARAFRGDLDDFLGDMAAEIHRMEHQLRVSRARLSTLAAEELENDTAKAFVEAARAAHARREDLCAGLKALRAAVADKAQEWERLLSAADEAAFPEVQAPAETGAQPPQAPDAAVDAPRPGENAAPLEGTPAATPQEAPGEEVPEEEKSEDPQSREEAGDWEVF